MRERLIELLKEIYPKTRYIPMEECREKTVDYLLQNGVVVLPCKVGDSVYFANRTIGEILKAKVISIELNYYTDPKEWITIEYISPYTGNQKFKSRIDLLFGETVFFTKEEAEKALEEIKENGNNNR